jgi:hypothetical protein
MQPRESRQVLRKAAQVSQPLAPKVSQPLALEVPQRLAQERTAWPVVRWQAELRPPALSGKRAASCDSQM